MPIRPENKDRYPKNWPWIRARILERAGDRCECQGECGQHDDLPRCDRIHNTNHYFRDGAFIELYEGNDLFSEIITERDHYNDRLVQRSGRTFVKVVLTVAHLDHTPENCDFSNLKAMCQRCHLAYDAQHHAQTRYETRRYGKVIVDMFSAQPTPAPSAGLLPGASNVSNRPLAALPVLQAGPRSKDREDPDDAD